MGITGELVRSVFSKSQSIPRHGSEKRKWSRSVRSYLCGDEHSSVLAAEEDLTNSFRSNVAITNKSSVTNTNTNTNTRDGDDDDDDVCGEEEITASSEATVEQPLPAEEQNSTFLQRQEEEEEEEDAAAFIIQSAFRNFMARRRWARAREEEERGSSPSIGTSLEVQTAHSIYSIKERDSMHRACTIRERGGRSGASTQVLKIQQQQDWDDSTVSSVMAKMRMQNRLEAATRRQRALAYAFSQQLRICSKKHGSGSGSDDSNMGWSWLERWMATRQPEMNLMVRNAAAMDEKESCGSNDLSSLVEFPTHFPPIPKDVNKVSHVEEDKDKRKRQKHPGPGLINKRSDAKN